MTIIKKLDALLAKHHNHISTTVLSLALVVTLGLVTPALLYAQEMTPPPSENLGGEQFLPPTPAPTDNPNPAFTPAAGEGENGEFQPPLPPIQPTDKQFKPNTGSEMMPTLAPKMPMNNTERPPQNNFEKNNGAATGAPGMKEMNNRMNDEQMQKQDAAREAGQLKMLRRQAAGMERGYQQFKKQIAKLQKQQIALPNDLAIIMTTIEGGFIQIKQAPSLEDAQTSLDSISEGIQSLMEYQDTLEKLARWPQTIKAVDRQLKNLTRFVKQDTAIVARLNAKGFDLSDRLTSLTATVAKLQSARDQAVANISNDPTAAFDTIENDFFGALDEAAQNHQVIQQLASLSKITGESKLAISQASRMIRLLKTKGEDTAELEASLVELKAKVAAIAAITSQKPIDADALENAVADLESLRQEFDGGGQNLPWTGGPNQFNLGGLNTGASSEMAPKTNSNNQF